MRQHRNNRALTRQFGQLADALHSVECHAIAYGSPNMHILGFGRQVQLGHLATTVAVRNTNAPYRADTGEICLPRQRAMEYCLNDPRTSITVDFLHGDQISKVARATYRIGKNGVVANRLPETADESGDIRHLAQALGYHAISNGGMVQNSPGRAPTDNELSMIINFASNDINGLITYGYSVDAYTTGLLRARDIRTRPVLARDLIQTIDLGQDS